MLLTEGASLMLQTAIHDYHCCFRLKSCTSDNTCFAINWAHSQGVPRYEQEFHLFLKKHSSKNNKHNWHGCLAWVPEQKGVGSSFAACLQGQHGCFSLESVTSHPFPEGSCHGWCCPDTLSHVSNMSRMSGPTTLVVSTAVELFAGSRCPLSCMDVHPSSVGQAPPVTWGTCSGRQGWAGAWHTLVDTYVLVEEGFLCGFHPVLFLLALSLIRYCIYHFQTSFTHCKFPSQL